MTSIDLNADMGESFGPWVMGSDADILKIVTSANVACGFHAGDPDVMARTVRQAVENDVAIGVHPGFSDLQGFGRRRMHLPKDTLRNLVAYQVGALSAVARAEGGRVAHLKLHGALANMASEDEELATVCYNAALDADPDLGIFVIAGTAQEKAARSLDAPVACEIFADRAYNDDATLVDRSQPGAMVTEPDVAAARILSMVQSGAIIAASGHRIETAIDTICLHGDTATALGIAAEVRSRLEGAGIRLSPPFSQ